MTAIMHSFDDVETAPMPWAMPLAVERSVGPNPFSGDAETARSVMDQILLLTSKTENLALTIASVRALADSTGLVGRLEARECFGMSMLSNTLAPGPEVQTLQKLAVAKAWIEKQSVSRNNFATYALLYPPIVQHHLDFGCHVATGSIGLLTRTINTASVGYDIVLDDAFFPRADPLADYGRYSVPNWDGEQAEPILTETIAAARSLLKVLPSILGEPDAAPAADGTIGFEWMPDEGPLRKLFIDVGPRTVWRAYWRLANGTTGETQGLTSDLGISHTMTMLFRGLSR
jgi:hypothetical protein